MTTHDTPCFGCNGPAHYDSKQGKVVCDGCDNDYFDGCDCEPVVS